jgi:hypothetical protein
MVTYEDCLALADLTPEEVDRIAAHTRLPGIVALQFGSYLARDPEGRRYIRRIIGDGSAAACDHNDVPSAVIPMTISAPVSRPGTKRLAA